MLFAVFHTILKQQIYVNQFWSSSVICARTDWFSPVLCRKKTRLKESFSFMFFQFLKLVNGTNSRWSSKYIFRWYSTGICTVNFCRQVPTFQKNLLPSSSGYKWFLCNVGIYLQNCTVQNTHCHDNNFHFAMLTSKQMFQVSAPSHHDLPQGSYQLVVVFVLVICAGQLWELLICSCI